MYLTGEDYLERREGRAGEIIKIKNKRKIGEKKEDTWRLSELKSVTG